MHILFMIFAAIFAVFIVIFIHELGHFTVAKLLGVKVLKFSIGFGKPIWSYTDKSGTQYILAMLPLGGYVRMLGENDEITTKADAAHAYNVQPVWVRMAIVAAGPIINFILAFLIFWWTFYAGVTVVKPVIGAVTPNSIMAQAGLQSGDEFKAINNQPVRSWEQVLMLLAAHMGDNRALKITVSSGQQLKTHEISLKNWKLTSGNVDLLKTLGLATFQPTIPPIVGEILKDSPAAQSGLLAGDKILKINNQVINDWNIFVKTVQQQPEKNLTLLIKRNHSYLTIPVKTGKKFVNGENQGYLGIMSKSVAWPADQLQKIDYSLPAAIVPAALKVWGIITFNILVLGKMLLGKISLHALGGPITIFQTAGKASEVSLTVYLGFVAFLSSSLGFINFLPIPGLDGGHLLFQIIEATIRRPVAVRYQLIGLKIGILLLLFLMVQATVNDIIRLFS